MFVATGANGSEGVAINPTVSALLFDGCCGKEGSAAFDGVSSEQRAGREALSRSETEYTDYRACQVQAD